ncbi:sister chromatid cohesion protein DCC1 isoform X2 [Centruroides vittatus]
MIHLSKLDDGDLKYVTQCLVGSEDFQNDGLKLMELDSSLLNELLKGKRYVIRGDKNDSAVLCTDTKTFEIKEAETSNSLLLLPDINFPEEIDNDDKTRIINVKEITDIFHSYFELRASRPNIRKLKTLLEENPYQGEEYEKDNVGRKYTFQDLLDVVQASQTELEKALYDIQAYLINGYWRLLDFDYMTRIFTFILNLVDSNSWPINEIPEMKLLDTLEDLEPREIVKQSLYWFADLTEKVDDDGDKFFKLNERKVCRFYAEILLRPAGKFNLEEFLECWEKCVPEGMVTSLSQLDGLALTDYTSKPNVIYFYPVSDLPDSVNERFYQLFKTQSKWTYDNIYPYIKDLTTSNQDVNVLLTKYTRASTEKGVKYYSSKQSSI